MDRYTQRLLNEAYALDDRARASYAQWEAKQAKPQRELIRKTYEPAQGQSMQQQLRDLEPEELARWNAWLDRRVGAKLDTIVDVIGTETGELEKRLRAEIAELHKQIIRFQTETEVLRSIAAGKTVSFKGGRDAA